MGKTTRPTTPFTPDLDDSPNTANMVGADCQRAENEQQRPQTLCQGQARCFQAWQAHPPPEELGRYGARHALPILDIDNPSTSIRRGGGRQCSEERRSAGCSEQIDHLFVVW